jgi:hypothetical protein
MPGWNEKPQGGEQKYPATVGKRAQKPHIRPMTSFDFKRPAELYPSRSRAQGRRPIKYRRFQTAAEALRFAVEELPPSLLLGAVLEVGEQRFDGNGIRALYDRPDYPLKRRKVAAAKVAEVA